MADELRECEACGKDISTEARVCPHCGKRYDHGAAVALCLLVLLGAILLCVQAANG